MKKIFCDKCQKEVHRACGMDQVTNIEMRSADGNYSSQYVLRIEDGLSNDWCQDCVINAILEEFGHPRLATGFSPMPQVVVETELLSSTNNVSTVHAHEGRCHECGDHAALNNMWLCDECVEDEKKKMRCNRCHLVMPEPGQYCVPCGMFMKSIECREEI